LQEQDVKRKLLYIAIILISFVPSYTETAMDPRESYKIITEVMSNPIIDQFDYIFILGKIILLSFFFGTIFLKNKFSKIYSVLAVLLLLPVIVFQNMSNNTSHGFTVLIGNIIVQSIIVGLFAWEIKKHQNDFSKSTISPINIITIILAFLAFWMPAQNGSMYFHIKDIFFNEAGFTFCMIIPIIIASLLMYYKTVNLTLLTFISFIGIYYGLLNQITWFILNPVYWWMGILHLPLLINSLIGFILAIKRRKEVSI
jgi:hypothetical protein